jgi:methionyl aminopeptidase
MALGSLPYRIFAFVSNAMPRRNKTKIPFRAKTWDEIELMRESALLVSRTLGEVARMLQPGTTTQQLDEMAEQFIRDNGGEPGFKGLYGCPSTLLCSVNDAVVHGLPTSRPLREGDVVSVDCGVKMNGWYGDHAYTFVVGEPTPAVKRLIDVTIEALYLGIHQARVGNRIGDISYAIQRYCEKNGYGVVRDLVGHGLGQHMHEEPEVPNFGKKGIGKQIENGMVLAIEPMINMGRKEVVQLNDNWTIATKDGKPSAHFEHDVAVWNGEPHILSTFDYVEDALGIPRTTQAMMAGALVTA